MGVYSACYGSSQNVQVKSTFHAWRFENTHMDNTSCAGIIRLGPDPKY